MSPSESRDNDTALLGVLLEKRSFFHKNKRNYQERSNRSEKRTEFIRRNNGTEWRRTNISLKEHLKSGTRSYY